MERWYAGCDNIHGVLRGPWMGPFRDNEAAAQQDAREHIQSYPGHHVEVFFEPYENPG